MNQWYPKAKQLALGAGLNLASGIVKAQLVSASYVYSAAHDFLDDISGAIGSPVTLASKTLTDGVFDAADIAFLAVPGPTAAAAIVIYVDTGTPSTSPLALYIDGRFQVQIAAAAASSATTIVPEDLPTDIASGVVMTKISGTGPTTITTAASASAGARSITTAALSGALSADAVYEYTMTGAGLPVTPNGGDINITWSNGASKIGAL